MKNNETFGNSIVKQQGSYPKVQLSTKGGLGEETYNEIFQRIDCLMEIKGTIKVAIDGNSGAGKSTLGHILKKRYDCNLFHMDDFFLRAEQRTNDRLNEPGGNVDYLRFKEEVMEGIEGRTEFKYRPYDCKTGSLKDYVKVTSKRLNIIEGVYSMHPLLFPYYDLRVFLGLDPKEQSLRILERNGPLMHKRFIEEWIPLEDRYFEELGIPEKSHIVIHHG